MTDRSDKRRTRREMLRGLGRGAAMAALAGASGAALAGTSGTSEAQRCINRSLCCRCAVFDGCALPAALSAKQAKKKGRA